MAVGHFAAKSLAINRAFTCTTIKDTMSLKLAYRHVLYLNREFGFIHQIFSSTE